MVVCFHRHLKATLYTHADSKTTWASFRPLILLGIYSALKVDFGISSVEIVHRTTLSLPEVMSQIKLVCLRETKSREIFVSPDLIECTHVFVRYDATKKSLQPPYNGTLLIVRCTR
ncbi:unnamed protein product [Lepeophtheirus salmonis]|uniref:(salmon louse) hypothetical protein n=1 Tax=Lepeophtheirus salmonis TaxID=72036 RepID=A0A7R8H3X1_LEPSM|nr:unnamed protein product [Lepeophtheirus salmonis]CAF2851947.1 unnamed protein product [Lepeophtheirus salmonis]